MHVRRRSGHTYGSDMEETDIRVYAIGRRAGSRSRHTAGSIPAARTRKLQRRRWLHRLLIAQSAGSNPAGFSGRDRRATGRRRKNNQHRYSQLFPKVIHSGLNNYIIPLLRMGAEIYVLYADGEGVLQNCSGDSWKPCGNRPALSGLYMEREPGRPGDRPLSGSYRQRYQIRVLRAPPDRKV